MSDTAAQDSGSGERQPLRLSRLLPPGEPATVAEIVAELGLWERPGQEPGQARDRGRVMLNMISTADGRATLGGRSGAISASADRQLFHGLRSAVDAVLVGAGTVRAERYGRIIPDASRRAQRRARGLSDEPLACIVSGRMALEQDVPLLEAPQTRAVILTASAASLPAYAAHVDYVHAERDGRLDLTAAMTELRQRFALHSILCEGGPHLACQLLAAGLIDEMFLSLSPLLAGGEPSGGEALRILAGGELVPPVELELLSVLQSGSNLFLRYGVSARE